MVGGIIYISLLCSLRCVKSVHAGFCPVLQEVTVHPHAVSTFYSNCPYDVFKRACFTVRTLSCCLCAGAGVEGLYVTPGLFVCQKPPADGLNPVGKQLTTPKS